MSGSAQVAAAQAGVELAQVEFLCRKARIEGVNFDGWGAGGAVIEGALAATSKVAQQAPVEYRGELAAFEREAAIAKTQPAMSKTDNGVLRMNAAAAELAVTVSLEDKGDTLRFILIGERGGQAAGVMSRPDLQRIFFMLEQEVVKAEWLATPAPPAAAAEAPAAPAPKRLVN